MLKPAPAQWFELPEIPQLHEFISDTLMIAVEPDSIPGLDSITIRIEDDRDLPPSVLGIQQTDILKVIPVDQYLTLDRSLADLLTAQLASDSIQHTGTLYIGDLVFWYDDKPAFARGRRLQAYTTYYDDNDQPVSDWLWEISVDKVKKEEEADLVGRLLQKWIREQSAALKAEDYHSSFYPYFHRRQLINWYDLIVYPDGYGLNAHLTLDFPADQQKKWVRGSPGLYYRKARHHESVAIGGRDQHWYTRLNDDLVLKLNATFRFGFNNFDSHHYAYVDIWNLFNLNLSFLTGIEYRPVYLKGVFAGLGIHQMINLIPLYVEGHNRYIAADPDSELEMVMKVYEPGLTITLGVLLP